MAHQDSSGSCQSTGPSPAPHWVPPTPHWSPTALLHEEGDGGFSLFVSLV